jgi:membrane associated rhomboid family serine protease
MDPYSKYQADYAAYLTRLKDRFHLSLTLMMLWVIVLGGFFLAQDRLFDTQRFAIAPLQADGLIGILAAPLLHGSMAHLASNAFAFLIVGTLAGALYPRASLRAWPIIWLGSGLGTWYISLGGHHIGASGISVGLMFFLIGQGLRRRDRISLGALMLALFFFGGMVLSFLPQEQGISWEYHLSGAVFGLLTGLAFSGLDERAPKRLYSWDFEPDSEPSTTDFELETPIPSDIPVIWHRPEHRHGNKVIPLNRNEP